MAERNESKTSTEGCGCFERYNELLSTTYSTLLSLGQTDRQVVATGRKLNLHRDLLWVAKRTPKLPRKSRKSQKKNILMQTIIYFIG